MFLHLISLAAALISSVFATNEAHITSSSYSDHNDWGCTSENADAGIFSSGDSRTLLQNFWLMPIAWPSVVPTSTYLCTARYNITLDEPGRVVLNKNAVEMRGDVTLDSFATVAVVVGYKWVESNLTDMARFVVPGPLKDPFTRKVNVSKPLASGCGGGVLEVNIRSQIYSSLGKPAYYLVDDPVPGERIWRFLTSLDVEMC